jgi:hypothetical protein
MVALREVAFASTAGVFVSLGFEFRGPLVVTLSILVLKQDSASRGCHLRFVAGICWCVSWIVADAVKFDTLT